MAETQEKASKETVSLEKFRTADPRAHYMALDGLRGIAILGVMICHIGGRWAGLTKGPLTVPILGVNVLDLFAFGTYGFPCSFS